MTYAIIKTGGRQYRVAEGDTIDVDLLDVEAGKTGHLRRRIDVCRRRQVNTRRSVNFIAKVTAEVVEQRKDKKVIAFSLSGAKVITARSGIAVS